MDISAITDTARCDVADENPSDPPPAVDAIIRVLIADNALEAYMTIAPPQNGGAVPTLGTLEAALADCGVCFNINREKLEALETEPVYNRDILIAGGFAPVNGVDGTATFNIETGKKDIKLTENEDGTVNFYDLGIVENVVQGQVLCSITLPTEGMPGMSVTGKELPQRSGCPVPSYVGKNTELNEDGTAILAKKDGPVEFDGRKITVKEVFYIEGDVDASTGNIKVASNLTVYGTVMPCFKIESGENVYIEGTVENASIKAGGNIKLKSGITGSKLTCDGDLNCRFIQNCTIIVKGNITAEYILNSDISCGKTLKAQGSISRIIGGSCVVGQDIETGSIGSNSCVKTSVELSADPAVLEHQRELQAKLPELEKKIESLKPLISLLCQLESGNQMTPEKQELFENAQYSYDTSIQTLEETKAELDEITRFLHEKGYGKIVCRGTIYPGAVIVMGREALPFIQPMTKTQIYYKDGCICTSHAL